MLHKILKNRKIWAAALLMVLLALGVAQAAGVQPQKSSLSGQVATVVSVGTQVSEGSVLVTVKTLTEFGRYFVQLGADRAMNFDGGGSSEMVVNGKIMNDPSDGTERPVRVALGVFRK